MPPLNSLPPLMGHGDGDGDTGMGLSVLRRGREQPPALLVPAVPLARRGSVTNPGQDRCWQQLQRSAIIPCEADELDIRNN